MSLLLKCIERKGYPQLRSCRKYIPVGSASASQLRASFPVGLLVSRYEEFFGKFYAEPCDQL
ncbi:hypothetical protein MNBD_GAMMA10-1479 [hydrothermal vent metagenome]|uniref:Uncharacterized protein n=1 Tax=hydrothermal vent metagenome TaxID=652676 RepID=A0A3B0YP32_9ZZZZ